MIKQTWITSFPRGRYAHAMAYDRGRGRLAIFGGSPMYDENYDSIGMLWEYDHTEWQVRSIVTKQATSWGTTPPFAFGRSGSAMVYDESRKRLVLFGGMGPEGGYGLIKPLNDTWEWDGTRWYRITTAGGPSPRAHHAMAYDSKRKQVLLFGGYSKSSSSSTLSKYSDLWAYDGTSWKKLTSVTTPPSRYGHGLVYDRTRDRAVLYGGSSNLGTWEWDGANWSLRSSTGPGDRLYLAMAYDEARKVTLLCGGIKSGNYMPGTWEWNGSSWVQQEAHANPYLHAMTYVPKLGQVLRYGGAKSGESLVTWNGSGWIKVAATREPLPAVSAAVYDSARGKVVALGASSTWEWNTKTWSEVLTSDFPPRSQSDAMAYDAVRKVTVFFGGYRSNPSGATDETWEYDGKSWVKRAFAGAVPVPRSGHAMAYDAAHKVLVLYGGQVMGVGQVGDTWLYDGTSWKEVFPAQTPGVRSGHRLAYDGASKRVLLHGGSISKTTWAWDGTTWKALSAASDARRGPGLAYDSKRDRLLLFGGYLLTTGSPYSTYFFSADAWSQATELLYHPHSADTAGTHMVYHSALDRVLLLGVSGKLWSYIP